MDNVQMIMTIGILKGVQSQVADEDVKFALGECIELYGKLVQGYELKKPEVVEEKGEE